MNTWFTKNLGDAMLADEELESIKSRFLTAYGQSDASDEIALFYRHESGGKLHCDYVLYFTPAAHALAQAVGAAPCGKPAATDLGLVIEAGKTQTYDQSE
ncbi:MAG: hypothetical protein KDD92_00655 [Caldilineaceae bacterium]|nr:hypothetical protein [Caldilineaceae bacterium]